MDIPDFISQILKLKEKNLEEKVWELWLCKLPYMDKDSYVSYDEMLNSIKQQETKQEIPTNGYYVDQVFF